MPGVPVLPVIDADDERIGDYRALTDLELRTRWEPPNGLFIAEGELVIRRALRAGYRMRSALVDEKRVDQLAGLPPDAPVYAASPAVLRVDHGLPRAPGRAGLVPPPAACQPWTRCSRARDGWPCWRD